MGSTDQRKKMLMVAGAIVGFLVSFFILTILNITPDNSSPEISLGIMAIGVIAGIVAALILEQSTRKGYQAAFADGKNPMAAGQVKLPQWYVATKMNRSSYWFTNVFMIVLLFGGAFLAYKALPPALSGYLIGLLVIVFFVIRILLVRFRLNDISPDTQIDLAKKGARGIFGGWMIDFAPSSKNAESSFSKTQQFYLPDGSPNIDNVMLNLRNSMIWMFIVILVVLLSWYLL